MKINFFTIRKINYWLLMNIHFKFLSDGQIKRLKARLVAKDYTQTINYLETFHSIARLHSVRIILSVVVVKQWSYQLNIKNAFFHDYFQEVVYASASCL